MAALKTVWTNDEASFHGNFEHFDAVWSWPKPIQKPHPPMVLGGETDHTLKRIVKYADGWLPRAMRPEQVINGIAKLTSFADAAGRSMDSISISVFAPPPKDDVVKRFRDTPAERVILMVPPGNEPETLSRLDRYAAWV